MHAATGPIAPPSRRTVLRAVFTAAVTAVTAAALTPVLWARRPVQTLTPAPLTEETYRGRHIAVGPAGVHIDGRPLHVMRRADGSYLSGVNHFESFATPLELARAAVDELGTARLALAAGAPHHG
ncbi:tyrosinase cofactor [Streptomyces sp. NBC_00536]|uniref:tyrosinase family oxidase copper chaperone n=1 Tax=Streptomyces sp. NBC_00536 TaxID=2975769 RepID=UPI002E80DF45|nr:tyrosinase family oxidase copper chaperone [Streptomyces sp. NBC_00536]WUC82617.1 tyrosinase cofactor [Streptomyces sp. NBC_00536]